MTDTDASTTVDGYLDALFDRLAGTGAAGRRALIEVEDHLRASIEADVARGAPAEQAERDAVTRFGDVATIARRLRRTCWRDRLTVALSTAWLLAGLGLVTLGVVFLITAVVRFAAWPVNPFTRIRCTAETGPSCPSTRIIDLATTGLVIVAVGIVVLLARSLSQRLAGLARSARPLPAVLALSCALLTPTVLLVGFEDRFHVDHRVGASGPGFYLPVIAAATIALAALVASGWAVARRVRITR